MKASLTIVLLAYFGVLVLIESLFVSVLYLDIINADKMAHREYSALSLCQDISNIFDKFNEVFDAMTRARQHVFSRELASAAAESEKHFNSSVDKICSEMISTGLDQPMAQKLKTTTVEMIQAHKILDVALLRTDNGSAFKDYATACAACFGVGDVVIRKLHKLYPSQNATPQIFNIRPEQLLQIAALTNLVYLTILALFVERSISRPVSRLAEDCDKIKLGQALPKIRVVRTEIGSLQSSFQEMSETILQNNLRRKAYIAMMQTVQANILNRVQERLTNLSASDLVADETKLRLQKSRTNIGALMNLLQSMSDLLSDKQSLSPDLQLQPTSTSKMAHDACAGVESLLQARNIKLSTEISNLELLVDPSLIGRVILNLLSNAIKYSPTGGTVALSIQPDGKQIRFNIKDNGPGISAEGIAKLFKRFGQIAALDGINREGTGLGLVICKDFVEAHGGTIGCSSEPGKGSCFWFTLPIETLQIKQTGHTAISGQPEKNVSEKRGSIKTNFALTLFLFVSLQTILFTQLNSKLHDYESRAHDFALQKSDMSETQELLVREGYIGKRLQLAGLEMNVGDAKRFDIALRKQHERLSIFCEKKANEAKVHQLLLQAQLGETKLLEKLSYGMNHLQEIMDDPQSFRHQTEGAAAETIVSLSQLSELESAQFKNSYNWSNNLRTDVLTLLLIAGILDLAVIAVAALVGMKTTKRILLLKSKAEQFAEGKTIERSLLGKDEISFLDERLCSVANAIREAEYQRQEIMAIINHDLRTPLSSVLLSLELLLMQEAFSKVSDAERVSMDQSRKDLLKLLSQINDLLLLEKNRSGFIQAQKTSFKF